MILKLIQSLLPSSKEDLNKSSDAPLCKDNDNQPVDIVREALRSQAKDLNGLVVMGQPSVDRKKLKERVKSRVKRNLIAEFDDDEVTEEITERILDVAEFDPYFKEMFEEKD